MLSWPQNHPLSPEDHTAAKWQEEVWNPGCLSSKSPRHLPEEVGLVARSMPQSSLSMSLFTRFGSILFLGICILSVTSADTVGTPVWG